MYSVYCDIGGLHWHFGVDFIFFYVFIGFDGCVVGDVIGVLEETDVYERIFVILI